jgi:transposase InsO family protein
MVVLDILGPFLPEGAKGEKWVLVGTDHFTKWVEVKALTDHQAPTVADAFLEQWITHWGPPEFILTDRAAEFRSSLVTELLKAMHIDPRLSSGYRPQTVGATERVNRTLGELLRAYIARHNASDWPKGIQIVAANYRASPHATTGQTPNAMTLGYEIPSILDFLLPRPTASTSTHHGTASQYVTDLTHRLESIHAAGKEQIEAAQQRQADYYNMTATPVAPFKEGDLVLERVGQKKRGTSGKLQLNWAGPLEIVAKLSEVVYRLRHPRTLKKWIRHVNRLKRYFPRGHPQAEHLDGNFINPFRRVSRIRGKKTKAIQLSVTQDQIQALEEARTTAQEHGNFPANTEMLKQPLGVPPAMTPSVTEIDQGGSDVHSGTAKPQKVREVPELATPSDLTSNSLDAEYLDRSSLTRQAPQGNSRVTVAKSQHSTSSQGSKSTFTNIPNSGSTSPSSRKSFAKPPKRTWTSLSGSQSASSASKRNTRATQVVILSGEILNLQSLSSSKSISGRYITDGVALPGPILDVIDMANEPRLGLPLYLCLFKNDSEAKFLTTERLNGINLGSAFLRWWDDYPFLGNSNRKQAYLTTKTALTNSAAAKAASVYLP